MMRQQINLYQDELVDRIEPLSSRQAGLVLLLTILFLAGLGGYAYWRGTAMEPERARLEHRQEQLRSRITELERQYPLRQASTLLQERVVRLEREVRDMGQLQDFVLQPEHGRNKEMLASLEGLAQRHHAGLWLNQIRLARQGSEVELAGRALSPEVVPDYLQWLTDEGVFSGLVFSRLRIARLQEQPGHVDFSIGTDVTGTR